MHTATIAKSFLTVLEAADELQISERSLRTLIATGEIRSVRLGKKMVRIPRAELERIASCSATPAGAADSADSR